MRYLSRVLLICVVALAARASVAQTPPHPVLSRIQTIVVIFAENRSFDNLYGHFPGANGLRQATNAPLQRDRDGSILSELPAIWDGLTPQNAPQWIGQERTVHLRNAPFAIDDPKGFGLGPDLATRDLVHRFYQNQMQINGGRNDGFAAWGDSGALAMGHYDGSRLPMWPIARRFTLADNFFMAAFGGSFLNHFWLVCACTPSYPDAGTSPARGRIAQVDASGTALVLAPNSPASALDGPPVFLRDGSLTPGPVFYAVNTMQPPYQPSRVPPPRSDAGKALADPTKAEYLPPQTADTIGDQLERKGIEWAWFAGAWQHALDNPNPGATPTFQFHHHPLNYFRSFAPGTEMRRKRLRDGGLQGETFLDLARRGALPQVVFYK
ncbi:MAG: acid phosphatase, partial [Acetobacteraceae bacterium]